MEGLGARLGLWFCPEGSLMLRKLSNFPVCRLPFFTDLFLFIYFLFGCVESLLLLEGSLWL